MQQQHTEPGKWRDRVLVLLNEQVDLYASLELLSIKQRTLIEEENADALLEVLTQRQRLIDRVQRVSNELAPYREQWAELLSALPARDRDLLNEKVGEATRLVDSIAARDDRDRRAMEAQRATIAVQMRDVTHARGAVAAYAGKSSLPPAARFQDREG